MAKLFQILDMSSDSEEDFQSADEGSDNELAHSVHKGIGKLKNVKPKKGETPENIEPVDKKCTEVNLINMDSCNKEFQSSTSKDNNKGVEHLHCEERTEAQANVASVESNELNTQKILAMKEPKVAKLCLKKEKKGEHTGTKKLGSRIPKSQPKLKLEPSSDPAPVPKADILSNDDDNNLHKQNEEQHSASVKSIDDPQDLAASWNAWSGWGTSILTAASTITREVSRGVESVMETVEGGLGAPNPNELAKEVVQQEKEVKEMSSTETNDSDKDIPKVISESSGYGFSSLSIGSLVSGVSGALETASNKVLLGGLDTLEMIGRKTMDVLQEGDPRLEKKRAFLTKQRPNLSKILQEARVQNSDYEDELNSTVSERKKQMKQMSLLQIWDATEGPIHIEALSLVAKQCQVKYNSIAQNLPPMSNDELQSLSIKIKVKAVLLEDLDIENIYKELDILCSSIPLPLQINKVTTSWSNFGRDVEKLISRAPHHHDSIEANLHVLERDLYTAVAQMLSHVVAVLHKASEVSLVTANLNVLNLASHFQRLCSCVSHGLEKMSDEVCENLTKCFSPSDQIVSSAITNIYLQMAEGNDFLEQSLKHLILILLQVEAKQLSESSGL